MDDDTWLESPNFAQLKDKSASTINHRRLTQKNGHLLNADKS